MAKEGQVWAYNYAGGVQQFTVPADGIYEIYCYGAAGNYGGSQWGTGNTGYTKGALCATRMSLVEGTVLNIAIGQQPAKSVCNGFGEGSTNGNDHSSGWSNYVGGFATMRWDKWVRHGSTYGVGNIERYRGYPDGSIGSETHVICDSDKNHSGGACGGGGGGSSYIAYNGIKIISASGGNGASHSYQSPDGSGTGQGGSGGGNTGVISIEDIATRIPDTLYTVSQNTRDGNGYITIKLIEESLNLYYNGIKVKKVFYDDIRLKKLYFNNIKV